jgi:hypothetical protein
MPWRLSILPPMLSDSMAPVFLTELDAGQIPLVAEAI